MSGDGPVALLDEFCNALWLEDGLSRNTLESYRRDLRQFAEWLRMSRSKSVFEADRADLLAYLGYRFRRDAKPRSAARLLSSLKRFYRFLLREGRVKTDPTLQVESPKLPRVLPKTLTEDDVEALLGAPDPSTARGQRDRANRLVNRRRASYTAPTKSRASHGYGGRRRPTTAEASSATTLGA